MTPDPNPPPAGHVTQLLQGVQQEEDGARDALFEAVYAELRAMAGARMRGERPSHTLQPTALVHEAFVKLVGRDPAGFDGRRHFLHAAARAMRQILVDHARARAAQKRGGGAQRVTLEETSHGTIDPGEEVLQVHEAIAKLESIDVQLARVVELRYFAGLKVEETASLMDVTERTVYRLWERARIWLLREMT